VPATAYQHFLEDIARATAIVEHAEPMPAGTAAAKLLRSDLLRSGWMFAVGALDAYFCDAYSDVVAATIISKNREPSITLPDFFYDIRFPVRAILEPYENDNWRWRMAARKMMERENVLRLQTIRDLFNKFFPSGRRFFRDLLPNWILEPDSRVRLFGITRTAFAPLAGPAREAAINEAWEQMQGRYFDIFQRRHDCIHNCDRPKISPQELTRSGTVLKVIQDVEFLVNKANNHINAEFRAFLVSIGCSGAAIAQVKY